MSTIKLGIRDNAAQFSLLVLVNAFVGAMIGMERSILPQIAQDEFHLAAKSAILSFIVVFGITKAITNYLAGHLSDRFGRKHVLVGGWLIAVPVPFMLMWAPDWMWILIANGLLGISQGLTWSTTVIMKIDLSGSKNRGLAMGLNEFAGYFAVAISALATGWIAAHYGLRPQPFYLGIAFVVLGLGISAFLVRETKHHVALEVSQHSASHAFHKLTPKEIFWRTTLGDRNLSSVSQAGLVNNLNDGMAWGLFPIFFAAADMNLSQIGILAAIYPATWGIGQLGTGAWSDQVGRKWLIAWGMWVQTIGIAVVIFSTGFWGFAAGAALLGMGTAMVYPTLLAAIGDVAHPSWRASSVGVYRLWRDLGYAFGAVLAGITADAFGLPLAMGLVAGLTFLSGAMVAIRMGESHRRSGSVIKGKGSCIEVSELRQQLMNKLPVTIVDVRSKVDFQGEHVDGAINFPLDELTQRISGFSKDTKIITVCGKGGGRSEQAAAILQSLGFISARPLCGGTQAWIGAEVRRVGNG